MPFAAILTCRVLAAIGVGSIVVLPFLAGTPSGLHAVLVFLRFSAGATLISGIVLRVVFEPVHPLRLSLSSALFVAVVAAIAFVLSRAAHRTAAEPAMRGRVRRTSIASSARVLGIAALMVLRPEAP